MHERAHAAAAALWTNTEILRNLSAYIYIQNQTGFISTVCTVSNSTQTSKLVSMCMLKDEQMFPKAGSSFTK